MTNNWAKNHWGRSGRKVGSVSVELIFEFLPFLAHLLTFSSQTWHRNCTSYISTRTCTRIRVPSESFPDVVTSVTFTTVHTQHGVMFPFDLYIPATNAPFLSLLRLESPLADTQLE